MNFINLNPFLRMASFTEYLPHNKEGLPSDCRIIFITKGTVDIEVSGERRTMSENSLFYCRAGLPYKLIGNVQIELYVMNFDLTDANVQRKQIIPLIFDSNIKETPYDKVDDVPFLNSYLLLENAEMFKSDISFLREEMNGNNPFFQEMASAALKQLIIKIYRKIIPKEFVNTHLSDVRDFIHAHFTEKISNKQLAEIAGYHEYHLNRIFKEAYGRSVHQYIIDLRLEKAKHLLGSEYDTLSYISEVCGFANYTYFSSCFAKKYGCSPLAYRNAFRKIL